MKHKGFISSDFSERVIIYIGFQVLQIPILGIIEPVAKKTTHCVQLNLSDVDPSKQKENSKNRIFYLDIPHFFEKIILKAYLNSEYLECAHTFM